MYVNRGDAAQMRSAITRIPMARWLPSERMSLSVTARHFQSHYARRTPALVRSGGGSLVEKSTNRIGLKELQTERPFGAFPRTGLPSSTRLAPVPTWHLSSQRGDK